MSVTLFNAPLTASFQPSDWFLIPKSKCSLRFFITVAGAVVRPAWFLEFTGDPAGTDIVREVAEEDQGSGVVNMPKVVRNFLESGGADLAVGSHGLSAQLPRDEQFCRVQVRIAAGAGTATCRIDSVFAEGQPI